MCSYGCGTINHCLHLLLSPPPPHDDLLTPTDLGLPCVFKCSNVFVPVIDWVFVFMCVCVRTLHLGSLCTCMCVCIYDTPRCNDLRGCTSAALQRKACQISQSRTCRDDDEPLQSEGKEPSFFTARLCLSDGRHDSQLYLHMWQKRASAHYLFQAHTCEHRCKR